MKNLINIFIIILFATTIITAQAPDFSKEVKAAMEKLSVMEGNWQGSGWRINPDRTKSTSFVDENIYFKLDGTLLVIEGVGKDENNNVVHNAYGVVSFDPHKNKYSMKSFLSTGLSIDANFEIVEANKKFNWWFKTQGRTIKYTLTFEDNVWKEDGEFSADGENFHKFFDMTLTKK